MTASAATTQQKLPRLPLTALELHVLVDWRSGSTRPGGPMAKSLGITYERLVTTRRRAEAKYRALRPALGDPEERRELAARKTGTKTREYALWTLARLEQFALIGVHEHRDLRSEDGKQLADIVKHTFWECCHALPERFYYYGITLSWRLKERQENNEEPALSPLERQRFDTEARLIELWGDLVAGGAMTLTKPAYPPKLPLDRAEPFIRWLGSEIETLRIRAEAKAAALKSA